MLLLFWKLEQWASYSHVRLSCAHAQHDFMEFVSKSYKNPVNPTVLKTKEMSYFVLISVTYFYVLLIPNFCCFRMV